MEKIGLLIDSCSLTRPDLALFPFVKVADLNVTIDGVDYQEHELPTPVIIGKLHTAKKMTTSQPSPGLFLEKYQEFHQEGYTHVLVVVLSPEISGTAQSATIAKGEVDFPLEIVIRSPQVASFGVALGLGLLCQMIVEKQPFSAVVSRSDLLYKNATLMFTLSNLMNLFKGGRLGIVSAFLGTILHIKPIIKMIDGKLNLVKKERTSLACYEYFMEVIKEYAEKFKTVYVDVIHLNRQEWGDKMMKDIHELYPNIVLRMTEYVSPVFFVHLGDQGFGFAIIGE